MKGRATRVAWLLPLVLAGCVGHRHKDVQQQQQQLAPPVLPKNPPPPKNTPINLPQPRPEANIPPSPQPTVKPAPQKHPRKPASKQPSQIAAGQPAPGQQASSTPPATSEGTAVSAIGQLSSGDATDALNETQRSISDVERGLNNLTRKMSDQELRTVTQIREFLKEARAALGSGDADGAHTLATKARVLLTELNP